MPRIVGGSAKGRTIKLPPGDVRPATARLRQALFDYISQLVPNSRILDLYCGSGGLGLEALSRGSADACFIDLSERSIETAKDNARTLGFLQQSSFHRQDVFKFLKQYDSTIDGKFDLIFVAPPYRIAEPERLLHEIASTSILEPDGVICIEYSKHTNNPSSESFILCRRKIYGETVIDVWEYI